MTLRRTSILAGTCTLVTIVMVSTTGDACAQTRGAVFGGADYGRDWSASAGAVVSVSPDSPWAVRGIVTAGGYDYESVGTRIEGEFTQADVVVLHQSSGSWGYFNVGGGARYTDTTLSPDDTGNGRRGGKWDGLIAVDGIRRAGDWEAGGFASYGVDMQEYYVRARVTRRLGSDRFRLGLETIVQGDPNYDRQGVAVVALHRAGSIEFSASAGVRGGEGQISLGIVRAF